MGLGVRGGGAGFQSVPRNWHLKQVTADLKDEGRRQAATWGQSCPDREDSTGGAQRLGQGESPHGAAKAGVQEPRGTWEETGTQK